MAYKITNFLEGLTEEEIEIAGRTQQVQLSSDEDDCFYEYFDTVEEAQNRIEALEE